MKISRNSWHYRFLSDVHISVPRSLCKYFWLLVGTCFVTFCMWLIAALVVAALLSPFIYMMFGVGLEVLLLLSIVVWNSPLIYLLIEHDRHVGTGFWTKPISAHFVKVLPKKTTREAGLFAQWLRAKKEKICPRITFTD